MTTTTGTQTPRGRVMPRSRLRTAAQAAVRATAAFAIFIALVLPPLTGR